MSTLAHISTNSLIITRLTAVSGYKQDFTTVTGIKAHVQPLSPAKTELYNGAMGKTYTIYADGGLGLQEGDKLRDVDTGDIYKVANGGVSRRTMGAIDYSQVIVELIS